MWALWAGGVLLGLLALPQALSGCRGPRRAQLIRQLAAKWGPVFGVPSFVIVSIASVESDFRPTCVNRSKRASSRGGAWGATGLTLTTAEGIADRLASHSSPEIRRIAQGWDRRGEGLLDPTRAVVFAASYLGALWREFGNFRDVAAAYHQGAGKVREVLSRGGVIPDDLPPIGREYVARALAAREEVA